MTSPESTDQATTTDGAPTAHENATVDENVTLDETVTLDGPGNGADWVDVGGVAELTKARRTVIDGHSDHPILVLAHEGSFFAFDNICIHRERELSKGVILKGRLVCPGHQWAFDLNCGWESVKSECQPTYPVRVNGDRVEVDVATPRVVDGPPD